MLLDCRGDDVTITDKGGYGSGREFWMWRGVDGTAPRSLRGVVTITVEVVKAAAGNPLSGEGVMELLLQRRGADVTITDEAVNPMVPHQIITRCYR